MAQLQDTARPHDTTPIQGVAQHQRDSSRRYWIAVVAADIVERGRAGGYAELSHGQPGFLERVCDGDCIAFYSPRASDPRGATLQMFTALGSVADASMYRVERDDGSQACRVAVHFASAAPAPIRPMLDELSFVRSREHWGVALRYGSLRVRAEDFARIASAMGCADVAGSAGPVPGNAQTEAAS